MTLTANRLSPAFAVSNTGYGQLRKTAPCGLILPVILALALPAAPTLGATATTTFAVSATVEAACSISAAALSFGTYTGATINATTTITATCTNTTPYSVGLNPGTSAGASVTTRKMTGPGSSTVAYALYSDPGHTLNWGQTVGVDTVSATGNGNPQSLTVYGQTAAGQLSTPGSYSDTITVTVTY